MQKVTLNTAALILLAVLTACSGPSRMTPTAPSASSAPPPVLPVPSGTGSGTMTIRELSPSPGTTLTVSDCAGTPTARRCAEQWRSTVDVLVDRDMTNAVLVMTFYEGDRLCGLSANTADLVRAGIPETFALSSIHLSSGSPSLTNNPCQLPTRTTRIKVELWSDSSSWTNTLKMELPGTYTFVSR